MPADALQTNASDNLSHNDDAKTQETSKLTQILPQHPQRLRFLPKAFLIGK